jgi:hypothetical protein
MTRVSCGFLIALLAACDAPRSDGATIEPLPGGGERVMSTSPADSGAWQLRELHVIQPAPGTLEELLDVRSVAMDDAGTVYVSENVDDQPLKVFNADGSFHGWIGRVGEGPGEFRAPFLAARGRDTLVVHDPQVVRTTWYGADGTVLTFAQTACCNFGPFAIDAAGRAVVPLAGPPTDSSGHRIRVWARYTPLATSADTVTVVHYEPEATAPIQRWEVIVGGKVALNTGIPLQSCPFQFPLREGFVIGWPGRYEFRVSSNGADTARIFGRVSTPVPISEAERQRQVQNKLDQILPAFPQYSESMLREAFDPARIPDHYPAWEWIWESSDGLRWVQAPAADPGSIALDVFDARGVWRDQVRVPRSLWPTRPTEWIVFGRDRVAALVEAADGRPAIRVFEIVRP